MVAPVLPFGRGPRTSPQGWCLGGREPRTVIATGYTPGVDENLLEKLQGPEQDLGQSPPCSTSPLDPSHATQRISALPNPIPAGFPFPCSPQHPDHYSSAQHLFPFKLVKGYLCASPQQVPSFWFDFELATGVGASPPLPRPRCPWQRAPYFSLSLLGCPPKRTPGQGYG